MPYWFAAKTVPFGRTVLAYKSGRPGWPKYPNRAIDANIGSLVRYFMLHSSIT